MRKICIFNGLMFFVLFYFMLVRLKDKLLTIINEREIIHDYSNIYGKKITCYVKCTITRKDDI
jgi:hypothetical protein